MESFIAKKQSFTHLSSASPPSLAICRDSHSISKGSHKPKIRIIHIFAPEIIKTDVANFRELVQRLTGKPTERDCKKATKERVRARKEEDKDGGEDRRESKAFPSKPLALRVDTMKGGPTIHELLGLDTMNVRDQTRVIKQEEYCYHDDHQEDKEIWNISGDHGHYNHGNNNTINPSGGFLDRFSDLEGFIEELNNSEYPLLPSLLNSNLEANSHHVQYGFGIGGPQLA